MRSIGALIWKYLNLEPVVFSLRKNHLKNGYDVTYSLKIFSRPGRKAPIAAYLYAEEDRENLMLSLERAGYELRPKVT